MKTSPESVRPAPIGGSPIAYRAVGQGPQLLFCNGLAGGWSAWSHQVRYFSERYRVLGWEYRGLHDAQSPIDADALSVSQHARDALSILGIEQVQRVAIVGWSIGVQVSLEMFRQSPENVAALVLISGVPGSLWDDMQGGAVLKHFVAGIQPPVLQLWEPFWRRIIDSPEAVSWLRRLGLVSTSVDQEVLRTLLEEASSLRWEALAHILREYGNHNVTDVLDEIDVPTLVIAGDRDPMAPRKIMESMVRSIRGAELMMVPGATHCVAFEQPELVNLRIEKFLRERGYVGANTQSG